jgi:hypothetical protein
MKVSREAFFQSLLQHNSNELLSMSRGLLSRMEAELVNTPVGVPSRVNRLPRSIDPNKPPRNYREAMQREDRQEWVEAYNKEYQGFIEQGTLINARPEKGAKVLDITTRANYKVTNGVFKIRLCVCCNQQAQGVN